MKRATAIMAGIVSISCAAATRPHASRVHEDSDRQSQLKMRTLEVKTQSCQMPTVNDGNDAVVRLIFNVFQSRTEGAQYLLVVDMTGGQFVHPGRRGTLELLTDSGHNELLPADNIVKWSDHPWSGGREKREQIPFAADREILEKVAGSKVFQFRVNASDRVLERCTDAKELGDLHELLGRAATL